MSTLALGLIETRGLVAAIEAADAAAKAATVSLESAELLGGGIVTLRIRGDLGAVQAAVEAGAQAAKRIGEVLAVRVIPRPVDELERLAPSKRFAHAEQDRSLSRHERISVRTSNDAPSGARPEKTDIRVPRSKAPKSPSRETFVPGSAGRRAQRTEITGQISAPPRPVPAFATVARPSPATAGGGRASLADLEAMPVIKLRQYARSIKNLPLQGRQISMANKTQLLEAIRQAGG